MQVRPDGQSPLAALMGSTSAAQTARATASAAQGSAASGSAGPDRPRSPVEAARQFEEVLVREFVRTMTKGLFDGGGDGPGWVQAYGGVQADAVTDAVTKQLVDGGTLGISDLLLDRWQPPVPRTSPPTSLETP